MSTLNTSPYFTHLLASASPRIRRELQESEQKPNSFVSTRTVLTAKYGQLKTN